MDIQLRTATRAYPVTPSDSTDLPKLANKGLFIGGAGNVSVITGFGQTVTFTNVPVGFFPVSVKRVNSTSTTATNIVALA